MIKKIAVLTSGQFAAILISFVALPIITRIYDVHSIGEMSFFLSMSMLLGPILSLRYVVSIPLPKSDKLAKQISTICIGIIIANGVFFLFFY